jgi:chalcone isomerase-like protein
MASDLRSLALGLLVALPALGAEVGGVSLDDKAKVGSSDVVLNGTGIRKRVFFQVYAIGLYLPKKTDAAKEAVASPGAKRILIHMLRDVGAEQFTSALVEGIHANQPEAEARAQEARLDELVATMTGLKEAKRGMRIALDWTGSTTQLFVDGKPAGRPIDGEDFYRALLRIWLGDNPVQDDLKKSLLGSD